MLSFQDTKLTKLIVHYVGSKLQDEGVKLSDDAIDIVHQPELAEVLSSFFLSGFKEPVFYNFHHVTSLDLNEVYTVSKDMFRAGRTFVKKSKDLANLLYEYSNHPKVKGGELYVVYFEGVNFKNEITDAVGIFKSENRETFLKVIEEGNGYQINHDSGISTRKPEKACLIFDLDEPEGYRVCILDNQNASYEAQYWRDDFLKLKPVADNYFQTQNYMSLAKEFVTGRLDDDFEISKADQIDYLNRSVNYFKKNEQFNEQDFANEVFEHKEVIQSFKNFKRDFQQEHDLDIVTEFDISTPAVKRQARIFKSVLKLDRNFHIYIHGDRELIEKGIDGDGRKYYKIYYNQES